MAVSQIVYIFDAIALLADEVNRRQFVDCMRKVLTDPSIKKVFHDLRFDAHILQQVWGGARYL